MRNNTCPAISKQTGYPGTHEIMEHRLPLIVRREGRHYVYRSMRSNDATFSVDEIVDHIIHPLQSCNRTVGSPT